MGQIVFLFSGQGDQHPGMGRALAEQYPAAAAVFARCDAIRPDTSKQCFEGTPEELQETRNTQPCLFAYELAAVQVLLEAGIRPAAVAGFSLGEVAAATVAGVFDLETGFRLVCRRAELMQQAAERCGTAMAAVVKLDNETVEALCAEFSQVYPVNYNCPGQITVAGRSEQMPAFSERVRAAGGRALPLKVNAAFHSPFMEEASVAFAGELAAVPCRQPELPLYANLTAEPYAGDPAALLARQICSPVQWERSMRNLIAAGADTFIEIGPGKTLSNMMKKIDPDVRVYRVSELEPILAEVAPC